MPRQVRLQPVDGLHPSIRRQGPGIGAELREGCREKWLGEALLVEVDERGIEDRLGMGRSGVGRALLQWLRREALRLAAGDHYQRPLHPACLPIRCIAHC